MRLEALEVGLDGRVLEDVVGDEGRERPHADELEGLVHREEQAVDAFGFKKLHGFVEGFERRVPGAREHVGLLRVAPARAVDRGAVGARASVARGNFGTREDEVLPALDLPGLAHPPARELHDDRVGRHDLRGLLGGIEVAGDRRDLDAVAEVAEHFGGEFRIVRIERAAVTVEGRGAVHDENLLRACCRHDSV